MRRFLLFKILIMLLCSLLLVACNFDADNSNNNQLSGRILLWHGFNEEESVVLHSILDQFGSIYADIQVVSAAVPEEEFLLRYQNTAAQGLGPDLLIGSSDWIAPLAEADLILDINRSVPETEAYLPTAVESLRLGEGLYGLPLSLAPVALYYNSKLVDTPASTLDDLLLEAANGKAVALNTNFDEAFWGIQAFGGQLFDDDGRVILDQGGFANWLGWLKSAQEAPGMILNNDQVTLRDLFSNQKAAYYVAGPEELPILQEALGHDAIGVVPLPAGPNGPAGPLLRVETIMFNPSSSTNQHQLALTLAKFLSNAQQNTVLMRELGRVPANQRVRVDPRVYPAIDGFATQARSAVPMSNLPQMESVRRLGQNTYTQVLLGVKDLTEAAYELTNQVNEEIGFSKVELPEVICQQTGRLQVWHRFPEADSATLRQITNNYVKQCPGVTVSLTYFPPAELYDAYTSGQNRPDLIIGSHEWVFSLAEAELIKPITSELASSVQQRYLPTALEALRVDQALYGLPISLDFVALYYKTEIVDQPPVTLDELLTQAAAGQEVALPSDFEHTFWAIPAFGGQLFDEELLFSTEDVIDWLSWLQSVQEKEGITLDADQATLQSLFTSSDDMAYYVGSTAILGDLQATLGHEEVRVAALPTDSAGQATPLLSVDAFLFTEASPLALAFADFATAPESQALLMKQAQRVPANINVQPVDKQALSILMALAQSTIALPNVRQAAPIHEMGDQFIMNVLSGQQTPDEAACQFLIAVNQANGLSATCPTSGEESQ